jgi:hypothetical protein
MMCQHCGGREARYVACVPPSVSADGSMLTCALCPIAEGWDSILIRSVPALLKYIREELLTNEPPPEWADRSGEIYDEVYIPMIKLRAIVGKDLSR